MKIDEFHNEIIAVISSKPAYDVESKEKIGLEILQHLTAVENLSAILSDSDNLKRQIETLKGLIATYVPLNSNILEKNGISESVIYRIDDTDPFNQSEIKVIGGAGRYSVVGLKRKAAREAAQIAEELSTSQANYQGAEHLTAQLQNTLRSLNQGLDELQTLTRSVTNEQHVEHVYLRAVGLLRNAIVDYGRKGKPITDAAMNKIIKNVLEQEPQIDMNTLIQTWKSSKAGLSPLEWAKITPDIHDTNVHSTKIHEPLDEAIKKYCIMEMFETMRVGLGDKAWVSISKRLRSQGIEESLVISMIDRAIELSSNRY